MSTRTIKLQIFKLRGGGFSGGHRWGILGGRQGREITPGSTRLYAFDNLARWG